MSLPLPLPVIPRTSAVPRGAWLAAILGAVCFALAVGACPTGAEGAAACKVWAP